MATISGDLVLGVFDEPKRAQAAVKQLRAAGFSEDDVGLVARHDGQGRLLAGSEPAPPKGKPAKHHDRDLLTGAEAGAIAGAGVGGLWAVALATAVLPLIGPVVAAGLLTTLAAGAASGAVAGGLIGALVGLGLSEQEARHVDKALTAGRIIVTVRNAVRQQEAADLLNEQGAENIAPPAPGSSGESPKRHLRLTPDTLGSATPTAGGFTPSGGLENMVDPSRGRLEIPRKAQEEEEGEG